jgi:sigma-B regulation protein RsbU (phosphoserine phosphatase)
MFATLVIGVIDLKTKELSFSTAGHPPFLVKDENSIYTPIPAFYPPIATFEDLAYENRVIKLNQNTTIVVFSDGVNEAENRKKELYGMENLTKELVAIEVSKTEAIKEKLLKKIKLFTKGEEQSDDLTMIVISV